MRLLHLGWASRSDSRPSRFLEARGQGFRELELMERRNQKGTLKYVPTLSKSPQTFS